VKTKRSTNVNLFLFKRAISPETFHTRSVRLLLAFDEYILIPPVNVAKLHPRSPGDAAVDYVTTSITTPGGWPLVM